MNPATSNNSVPDHATLLTHVDRSGLTERQLAVAETTGRNIQQVFSEGHFSYERRLSNVFIGQVNLLRTIQAGSDSERGAFLFHPARWQPVMTVCKSTIL